ncbi:uncharacterized protein [Rutidosis leptorrhynchoides]|uniref:uncharacterized protein isoform X2 n=1 Tax=Rutidosis leptorrhynchoides TaxID=125765 RepID=UPI003A995E0A
MIADAEKVKKNCFVSITLRCDAKNSSATMMSFLQHLFLQVRRTLTLSVKSLEDKSSKSRDVYNLTMVVNGLQTTAQFIFLCVSPLIDII